MEKDCSNNVLSFEDLSYSFNNQMNNTSLDDSVSHPKIAKRDFPDMKFSPILRPDNDDNKKSVFGRRMALCKLRGESPLASKVNSSIVETTETVVTFSKTEEGEYGQMVRDHTVIFETDSAKYPYTPKINVQGPKKAVNPFHYQLLDSIHLNTLSPGLFEPMNSPKDKENIWSIDERAILIPAEITEEEIKMTTYSPDPIFEAKIHAGLDVYWRSNAGYVPSPEGPRPLNIDSSCQKVFDEPQPHPYPSPNGRPPVARRRTITKRNVKSQTSLTIPPHCELDFQKLLGDGFCYDEEDEAPEEEFNATMNTSLPRKLFSSDECLAGEIDENEFITNPNGDKCDLGGDEPCLPTGFDLDLSPIKKDED